QSTAVKHTGYSGIMIPIKEDNVLARRWSEGTFTLDSILAYSAVCAGGVDTLPLPGDVSEEQIARILGDVAWLAYRWNKPLAARLLPAPGKRIGDQTEFANPSLTNTTIQPPLHVIDINGAGAFLADEHEIITVAVQVVAPDGPARKDIEECGEFGLYSFRIAVVNRKPLRNHAAGIQAGLHQFIVFPGIKRGSAFDPRVYRIGRNHMELLGSVE